MLTGVVLAGLACSHTRPDEMSAEAHRAEAAQHESKARQEEAQYDPSKSPPSPPPQGGMVGSGPVPLNELWVYNPTEYHRYNAEKEREHALDHLRAAQKLEDFESGQCQAIPPEARSACPLLSPFVREVRETPRGVVLELKKPEARGPLLERMRCHWAFARTRAFSQDIACPLYERGVTLEPVGDAGIAVEGKTSQAVEHIRADLRELYLGGTGHPSH